MTSKTDDESNFYSMIPKLMKCPIASTPDYWFILLVQEIVKVPIERMTVVTHSLLEDCTQFRICLMQKPGKQDEDTNIVSSCCTKSVASSAYSAFDSSFHSVVSKVLQISTFHEIV
mmetsp:Transcript_22981/g.63750  ORF Transcript_22981/g.63750 Transcript_22981/m.63750 type:complete len:116 (-) Transcript_22981:156-503(-)